MWVLIDYMGGGFGVKFGFDCWGIVCVLLVCEVCVFVWFFLECD